MFTRRLKEIPRSRAVSYAKFAKRKGKVARETRGAKLFSRSLWISPVARFCTGSPRTLIRRGPRTTGIAAKTSRTRRVSIFGAVTRASVMRAAVPEDLPARGKRRRYRGESVLRSVGEILWRRGAGRRCRGPPMPRILPARGKRRRYRGESVQRSGGGFVLRRGAGPRYAGRRAEDLPARGKRRRYRGESVLRSVGEILWRRDASCRTGDSRAVREVRRCGRESFPSKGHAAAYRRDAKTANHCWHDAGQRDVDRHYVNRRAEGSLASDSNHQRRGESVQHSVGESLCRRDAGCRRPGIRWRCRRLAASATKIFRPSKGHPAAYRRDAKTARIVVGMMWASVTWTGITRTDRPRIYRRAGSVAALGAKASCVRRARVFAAVTRVAEPGIRWRCRRLAASATKIFLPRGIRPLIAGPSRLQNHCLPDEGSLASG